MIPKLEVALQKTLQTGNKNHGAAFPRALPEWFIKPFAKPRGHVLDPFLGSGTTYLTPIKSGRIGAIVDRFEEWLRTSRKQKRSSGHKAKEKNEEFIHSYCDSTGKIIWDKVEKLNSGQRDRTQRTTSTISSDEPTIPYSPYTTNISHFT